MAGKGPGQPGDSLQSIKQTLLTFRSSKYNTPGGATSFRQLYRIELKSLSGSFLPQSPTPNTGKLRQQVEQKPDRKVTYGVSVGQTSHHSLHLHCVQKWLIPMFRRKKLAIPASLYFPPGLSYGLGRGGGGSSSRNRAANPLSPGSYSFFTSGLRSRETRQLWLPTPSFLLSLRRFLTLRHV